MMMEHFLCIYRNQRWGTCVDCPRSCGYVYPEFCVYTSRYDHQLTIDQLVDAYKEYEGE